MRLSRLLRQPDRLQAEVNDINKQKFLAELGKLLTFMYEEDRQTALAMYSKMFDDAESEEGLIQFLGTPTRQAVVIARTYNARGRKLQVESQSRELDGAEAEAAPDFVLAIDKLYQQYISDQADAAHVLDNQFSFFEDAEHPVEDGMEEVYPVLDKSGSPAQTEESTEKSAPTAQDAAEQAFDEVETQTAETLDQVESFLEDFNIAEDALAAAKAEDEALQNAAEEEEKYIPAEPVEVRKLRVPVLILFILVAVPLTLLGVAVLLVPTLLALTLAAVSIVAGAMLLIAAFGGFAILADFLLLFGAAIVLLALGLLFLWIFIWFIGGAIAGLVSGVIRLGRHWCYKEVSA